ncbi:HD-GYP domain-containing protein [Brevibacillus sp. 179-C9.3 HS]|uniref:HD-GYP domain-containing protein n=1 Tax=unclassified Brevibacillus TaxID=2684853 RepID=UPI0039A0F945
MTKKFPRKESNRRIRLEQHILDLVGSLVKAIDAHDRYTFNHSLNVAKYASSIGLVMKLPIESCRSLFYGGLLHDVGKIGVPEHILNKQGQLSHTDFEIVKHHSQIGYEILDVSIFKEKEINLMALYHHERVNGNGYPSGLKGEQIPQMARIMAVADVYDAMTTKRSYRPALSHELAMDHLREGSGSLYDSIVVKAFQKLMEDRISKQEQIVGFENVRVHGISKFQSHHQVYS